MTSPDRLTAAASIFRNRRGRIDRLLEIYREQNVPENSQTDKITDVRVDHLLTNLTALSTALGTLIHELDPGSRVLAEYQLTFAATARRVRSFFASHAKDFPPEFLNLTFEVENVEVPTEPDTQQPGAGCSSVHPSDHTTNTHQARSLASVSPNPPVPHHLNATLDTVEALCPRTRSRYGRLIKPITSALQTAYDKAHERLLSATDLPNDRSGLTKAQIIERQTNLNQLLDDYQLAYRALKERHVNAGGNQRVVELIAAKNAIYAVAQSSMDDLHDLLSNLANLSTEHQAVSLTQQRQNDTDLLTTHNPTSKPHISNTQPSVCASTSVRPADLFHDNQTSVLGAPNERHSKTFRSSSPKDEYSARTPWNGSNSSMDISAIEPHGNLSPRLFNTFDYDDAFYLQPDARVGNSLLEHEILESPDRDTSPGILHTMQSGNTNENKEPCECIGRCPPCPLTIHAHPGRASNSQPLGANAGILKGKRVKLQNFDPVDRFSSPGVEDITKKTTHQPTNEQPSSSVGSQVTPIPSITNNIQMTPNGRDLVRSLAAVNMNPVVPPPTLSSQPPETRRLPQSDQVKSGLPGGHNSQKHGQNKNLSQIRTNLVERNDPVASNAVKSNKTTNLESNSYPHGQTQARLDYRSQSTRNSNQARRSRVPFPTDSAHQKPCPPVSANSSCGSWRPQVVLDSARGIKNHPETVRSYGANRAGLMSPPCDELSKAQIPAPKTVKFSPYTKTERVWLNTNTHQVQYRQDQFALDPSHAPSLPGMADSDCLPRRPWRVGEDEENFHQNTRSSTTVHNRQSIPTAMSSQPKPRRSQTPVGPNYETGTADKEILDYTSYPHMVETSHRRSREEAWQSLSKPGVPKFSAHPDTNTRDETPTDIYRRVASSVKDMNPDFSQSNVHSEYPGEGPREMPAGVHNPGGLPYCAGRWRQTGAPEPPPRSRVISTRRDDPVTKRTDIPRSTPQATFYNEGNTVSSSQPWTPLISRYTSYTHDPYPNHDYAAGRQPSLSPRRSRRTYWQDDAESRQSYLQQSNYMPTSHNGGYSRPSRSPPYIFSSQIPHTNPINQDHTAGRQPPLSPRRSRHADWHDDSESRQSYPQQFNYTPSSPDGGYFRLSRSPPHTFTSQIPHTNPINQDYASGCQPSPPRRFRRTNWHDESESRRSYPHQSDYPPTSYSDSGFQPSNSPRPPQYTPYPQAPQRNPNFQDHTSGRPSSISPRRSRHTHDSQHPDLFNSRHKSADSALRGSNRMRRRDYDPSHIPPSGGNRWGMVRDLISSSDEPFSGNPERYEAWRRHMNILLNQTQCCADMAMHILSRNTRERPRSIIEAIIGRYSSSEYPDANEALRSVWRRLFLEFGSPMVIAKYLISKVRNYEPIVTRSRDDAGFHKSTRLLEGLVDLCRRIKTYLRTNRELIYFNTKPGMDLIISKLPPEFGVKWEEHVFEKCRARRRLQQQCEESDSEDDTPEMDVDEVVNFNMFVKFLVRYLGQRCAPYFSVDPKSNTPRKALASKTEVPTTSIGTSSNSVPPMNSNTRSNYHLNSQPFSGQPRPTQTRVNSNNNPVHQPNTLPLSNSSPTPLFNLNFQRWCPLHQGESHPLETCTKFLEMSVPERLQLVFRSRLCYLCFGEHFAVNCTSMTTCDSCLRRHHSLIHCDQPPSSNPAKGISRVHNFQTIVADPVNVTSSSCSKTVLVDVRSKLAPHHVVRVYCIVDEQSSGTFCDPDLPVALNLPCIQEDYVLSTMSGLNTHTRGGRVEGLEIRGVGEDHWIELPPTLTNPHLPDTRGEVALESTAARYEHLARFKHHFPTSLENVPVMLLVGTDCGEAMYTRTFGNQSPYLHHTALGWALVGRIQGCASSSRSSRCLRVAVQSSCEHLGAKRVLPTCPIGGISKDVFPLDAQPDDDLPGISKEDKLFLDILEEGTITDSKGRLQIPIPFKPGAVLPKNRECVRRRSINTLGRISKKPELALACETTMAKYLEAGHVEELPVKTPENPLATNYIPVFPISHPRKSKIRVVFDSSASYHGSSLNDHVLRGPNVVNRLLGVLLRFRRHRVGFCADVEAMFHQFRVPPQQTDCLRFYWWHNNKSSNEVVKYRALVHTFGNKCSPAVATWGLRYTTRSDFARSKPDAVKYIKENFYVDDGLASATTVEDAIRTLRDARAILDQYHIRLHKILCSDARVLEAFPPSELAVDVNSKELQSPENQSALGLTWDVSTDRLTLKYKGETRRFTRRHVLSQNASIFDPLGLAAPVVLGGKLLQRRFLTATALGGSPVPWDDPLPEHLFPEWRQWINQLDDLSLLKVPRCYSAKPDCIQSLYLFADASESAISHVAFLRSSGEDRSDLAFVYGSSKVAPKGATSIARLELCACVELAQTLVYLREELQIPFKRIQCYTDSSIVLGYIRNTERTFSRYVTSRVTSILNKTRVDQWLYVPTNHNPADIGTRYHSPLSLMDTSWLIGPDFLKKDVIEQFAEPFRVSDSLPESIKAKNILVARVQENPLDTICHDLVNRVSSWTVARGAIARILSLIFRVKGVGHTQLDCRQKAEEILLAFATRESFPEELRLLKDGRQLPAHNPLLSLAPFSHGELIRVGGRLKHGELRFEEKHPILLSDAHRVSNLILVHYHIKVCHQGRKLTTAAIRQAGFHITHQSAAIRKLIAQCVQCRRIRGRPVQQIMADLPMDRLERVPPFYRSGVDVFGPYYVHEGRKTRGRPGTKKLWVLLFTCLYSRAVHIEILGSIDTPSFQLALRRFFAIRGSCFFFRSDRGTNFQGAVNVMKEELDLGALVKDAGSEEFTWNFLPPGASHMAGVWERKVGAIKSVFDAALADSGNPSLSRDEFHTLMCEAVAIVNNTPLGEISADPNEPFPVCPANLLTLREKPNVAPPFDFSQSDLLNYGRRRWRRVQLLAEVFWRAWRRDYLFSLDERAKWLKVKRDLVVGDVVLLKDESPRHEWPMGIVVNVKPGLDSHSRQVTVRLRKSKTGLTQYLDRAMSNLILILRASET